MLEDPQRDKDEIPVVCTTNDTYIASLLMIIFFAGNHLIYSAFLKFRLKS